MGRQNYFKRALSVVTIVSVLSTLIPSLGVALAQTVATVNTSAPGITKVDIIRYKENADAQIRLMLDVERNSSQSNWNSAFQYYQFELSDGVSNVLVNSNSSNVLRPDASRDDFALPVSIPILSGQNIRDISTLNIKVSAVYNMSDGSLQSSSKKTTVYDKSGYSDLRITKESNGLNLTFDYDTNREAKNNNGNGINGWIFKQGDSVLNQGAIGSHLVTSPPLESAYSVITTYTDGKQLESRIGKVKKDASLPSGNIVISVAETTENSVRFTWPKPAGTANYKMEIFRTGENSTLRTETFSADTDGYNLSKLTPSSFYAVNLYALSASGQILATGTSQINTLSLNTSDLLPKNLRIESKSNGNSTYKIAWDAGYAPFVVEVFEENAKVVVENNWNIRSFDLPVNSNANYVVRVFNKADFDSKNYDNRGQFSFSTSTSSTTTTTPTTVPGSAETLTLVSESDGFKASWSAVSNVTGYKLTLYAQTSTGQMQVNSFDLGSNTLEMKILEKTESLTKGVKYFAAVQAKNDKGTGTFKSTGWTTFGGTATSENTTTGGGTTTTTAVTNLSEPSNIQVNTTTGEVTWNAVANATKYVFSLESASQCPTSGGNCNWGRVMADSSTTPSIKLNGLTGNTNYKFIVKARSVVTKDGKTETIDSTNIEKGFNTAKLAETWSEGLPSGATVSQGDGMSAKIENGSVILLYDLTKSPLASNANKLELRIMTYAEAYILMTKDIPANDRPQGRIEIPLGNIQGVPQISTILNSNGGAEVWLKLNGYNGSSLVSYRTSDSIRIPEAGSVTVSGGFSTQSTNGGTTTTTPVSIDAVSSLTAVYDKEKFEINATWGAVTGAAGYNMTVTGKDKDGKSFSGTQFVTTPSAKVGFPVGGSTYTIKVVAVHSTGSTSSSKETTVSIPLWKPYLSEEDLNNVTQTTTANSTDVNVTATVEGTGEQVNIPGYNITWTAITDQYFKNYRVFVRKKESNPVAWQYAANYDAAKDTKYRIVGLQPSTTYEYKITAQYVTFDSASSTFKTSYKDISTVKELTTAATQSQPESTNINEAYKRALKNERREMSTMSVGIRLMTAHIVYKDANGNSKVVQTSIPTPTLNNVPSTERLKEWYTKISPVNIPGTIEGVILTTVDNGPVEDGSKGALWAVNNSTELGSCIFNVSPYCDAASLTDSRKGIYIPKDKLGNKVLVEVLSLPSGGLRTYFKDGQQVTDVEFSNKFMGYPMALEFNLPTIGTADFPQASLLSVQGGEGNMALFPAMTTVRNVSLQTQFSINTTKCEVQENGGAWEEIQCTKDNLLHSIPYNLKTTQAGDVKLVVRASNQVGSRESGQVTLKYSTTIPSVTLTGVPTTWQTAGVKNIEARCGSGSNCTQVALVATNLLTPAQNCSDLQTIAPALPFTAVCSQDNNFCKNITFAALPGPNPTYMCAKTQDSFGVVGYAAKQELKADVIAPEASFELTGLIQAGANYFTNNTSVSLKMNDLIAGPSTITSCTIGGDISGTVACPAKGQTTTLNLTSGSATKRLTVTVKNGAGVENVFAKYILLDTSIPLFTEASNIIAYERNSNGTVKVKPALITDNNLDRIELSFSSSQSGFALPANIFASIYPGTSVEGNKIIIKANEDGQLDSSLITTGLSLQNLPAQVSGQYINYTISQKGFDKASNATSGDKQIQFTLQEQTSTEAITVTGGTVSLPATSTTTQIPLSITFSGTPVYYTLTKNGVEGAKVLYNGYIYLEAGDHTGLTVKFYNAQNQQIGDAFTNLSTKVAISGATATVDAPEVTRTKNATFNMKLLSVASDTDKVSYKVLRGGTQVLTGERQKAQFTQALNFDNLQLIPNSTNEFYVVITEAGGKETILKRTVIHDTEAPKPSSIQASIVENTKPKWTFAVTDAAGTSIQSVKGRITNLTTGEQRTMSNLTVNTNSQYEVVYNDYTLRPGHEYVLDIITEDTLGNTLETRTTTPLTRTKSSIDLIDMLQKAINIDNTIVNTDLMKVILANEKGIYTAEQMSRGKQLIFGDALNKGKNTNNQVLTRLPIGVYQMKIEAIGGTSAKTQTISNYVIDPYFADANADLNGDGFVGVTDEVLFKYGKDQSKYPTSNSEISALVQSIQAKLNTAKQANISEYMKR